MIFYLVCYYFCFFLYFFQVRLAVVETLGLTSTLLSKEHFDRQLPVILPLLLAMYKKERSTDHLMVSTGFAHILQV